MILYTENSKDSKKKTVQNNNSNSVVSGYKINIPKLAAFLHANNKLLKREIKKTMLFIISPKRIIT